MWGRSCGNARQAMTRPAQRFEQAPRHRSCRLEGDTPSSKGAADAAMADHFAASAASMSFFSDAGVSVGE